MQALPVLVVEVLVGTILLDHEDLSPQLEQGIQFLSVQFFPAFAMPRDPFARGVVHAGKLAPLGLYFCAMAGGNVLSVEGLTKRFGERLIFEDLHFGLDQGQKAALVARNGTGKSTCLLYTSDAADE